ncbi:MAG: MFS transporter, partial [Proteobacteria bacterium]|nr:MFS transporter [Pseudomonadota bacterium]
MPTGVPHGAGLYLAALQFLFTLGWTVYAIFLPQLAGAVGIPRSWVIWILLADQVIFAITDYAMGVAADKVARLVGRLGRLVAILTAISCLAFLALPFIAGLGTVGKPLLLAAIVVWAVTSSALRAPPLMLLGKYAARSSIPWLSSLALLGLGVAGAVAPYLTVVLRGGDPRWPFVVSSIVLLLTSLGLVHVERSLAAASRAAPVQQARRGPTATPLPQRVSVFLLVVIALGIGYQVHGNLNSAPQFLRFAKPADLDVLLPIFWIAFNVAMFPASLLTQRWGGLIVMASASVIGGVAMQVASGAESLATLIAAQLVAGAAWGAMMMSAVSAALAIGQGGDEGRVVGTMFSA